jgi:acyl dehydratase
MKFEELHLGQEFTSAPYTVGREEMLRFSEQFDPQPIHVDGDAGTNSSHGDIIASGFMTAALAWRLWVDIGVQGGDGVAGLGIEDLRWFKPLTPGTTVRAHIRIAEHRVTSQGHGLVTYEMRLLDEEGAELLTYRTSGLHARRNSDEPDDLVLR